ncbi:MAG: hypothetical protein IH988_10310 [Planctomycetes bacterium]|nr:hypothetical protein [Planctomycetota bacterium]
MARDKHVHIHEHQIPFSAKTPDGESALLPPGAVDSPGGLSEEHELIEMLRETIDDGRYRYYVMALTTSM